MTRTSESPAGSWSRIVCKAIRDYEPAGLTDVRVIAYADEEFETLQRVAGEVTHG